MRSTSREVSGVGGACSEVVDACWGVGGAIEEEGGVCSGVGSACPEIGGVCSDEDIDDCVGFRKEKCSVLRAKE